LDKDYVYLYLCERWVEIWKKKHQFSRINYDFS
jgi:hypothetical protein